MASDIPAIEVEPKKASFRGSFTKKLVSKHVIKNPNPGVKIAVKIKTSQVAQFRLSPVFAYIEGGGEVELTIVCKPFIYNPDDNYTSHRMVVLYTVVPAEFGEGPATWWKEHAQRWRDVKLPVAYEHTDEDAEGGAAPETTVAQQPTQAEGATEQQPATQPATDGAVGSENPGPSATADGTVTPMDASAPAPAQ